MKRSSAAIICRAIFGSIYASDIFLRLKPVYHHFMAAAAATQAKVRPSTQNKPLLAAAGMGLLHGKGVPHLNIHGHSPFMASQYCLAACSTLLGPYS